MLGVFDLRVAQKRGDLHRRRSLDGFPPRHREARALSALVTRPAPSAQFKHAPFAARSASSRSFASRMCASRTAKSISRATPKT